MRRIVIIAGEASSDEYGALMVRELQRLEPGLEAGGVGGPALHAAGVKLLYPPEDLKKMAIMGLTEFIGALGFAWRGLRNCVNLLRRTRPDLLILMDLPVFNMRLARHAKKLGIKVLYYITPQVWAWWTSRAARMAALTDHLAVVFPFEKDFYARWAPGLPVTFVGHPEMDIVDYDDAPWPLSEGKTVIGLLPGSRVSEIGRHMPLLMETAALLRNRRPDLAFAVPVAPGLAREALASSVGDAEDIALIPGAARQVMRRSRFLLTCSGTATLQAAVRRAPMAVFYKTGRINYFMCRRLMRVPHFAMPNLIHGGLLVPEFLQERATPGALSDMALEMLNDSERLGAMQQGLEDVGRRLGGPGASRRTAELALSMME